MHAQRFSSYGYFAEYILTSLKRHVLLAFSHLDFCILKQAVDNLCKILLSFLRSKHHLCFKRLDVLYAVFGIFVLVVACRYIRFDSILERFRIGTALFLGLFCENSGLLLGFLPFELGFHLLRNLLFCCQCHFYGKQNVVLACIVLVHKRRIRSLYG